MLEDGLIAPEARYERRESVELAFIAAVQHLPATQRAVLLMREVLGFSAREVAEALDTSVASVNSALQRARKAVEERVPAESQQATLRALGDDGTRRLVDSYMSAMADGDVPKVVSLLTEEASWSMPPLATWWTGRETIGRWLGRHPLNGKWEWRHVPTRVSGQLAVGTYTWHSDAGAFLPFSIDVLTVAGDRIAEVTSFISRSPGEPPEAIVDYPDRAYAGTMVDRFELPARLER
jgi:RNA polymerase sigma-70 factor (ECF subfamily)